MEMQCNLCGKSSTGIAECDRGHKYIVCLSCLNALTATSLKKMKHSKNARESNLRKMLGKATDPEKRRQGVRCMRPKCNEIMRWKDVAATTEAFTEVSEDVPGDATSTITNLPSPGASTKKKASPKKRGVQKQKLPRQQVQAASPAPIGGRSLPIVDPTRALFIRGLATQTVKADVEKAFFAAESVSVWRHDATGMAFAAVVFASQERAKAELQHVRRLGGIYVGYEHVDAACVLPFRRAEGKGAANKKKAPATCKKKAPATCSESGSPLGALLRLWGVLSFAEAARKLEAEEVTADLLPRLRVDELVEVGIDCVDASKIRKCAQGAPPTHECPFCKQAASSCGVFGLALKEWHIVARAAADAAADAT